MTWNVNQPGRWRRPTTVPLLKEEDTDWKRYLMNRPWQEFDPRKYLEFRLFWPFSSGIPGQWMAHQIDTVHWFTGYNYPRSVAANGGIYLWNDGRTNYDTMTAVPGHLLLPLHQQRRRHQGDLLLQRRRAQPRHQHGHGQRLYA